MEILIDIPCNDIFDSIGAKPSLSPPFGWDLGRTAILARMHDRYINTHPRRCAMIFSCLR